MASQAVPAKLPSVKLRLGIVGVGKHGIRYARHAARDVEGIELVAVSRRDVEAGNAVAEELGCRFEADARELAAARDIDALVLVTVPDLLPELVEIAAAAGKHLLVEKPVAPDLATGRAMARALARHGTWCLAGQTLRWNGICRALRDAAPELGRIDSVVLTQRFPPQQHLAWIDDPARSGGGNILHTGVHCFDQIRFLTGLEITSVACAVSSVHTRGTEDNFAATLRLRRRRDEDGDDGRAWPPTPLAMVTCSRSTDSRNGTIEISGEAGQIGGDHVAATLWRADSGGLRTLAAPAAGMTVLEVLRSLVAEIASGREPSVGYGEGLQAVAVADACYRAATSGRFEDVEQVA